MAKADLFAQSTASFRDQLLAGKPAVGSDGATWELALWGQKGFQFWGFARTAPGEITLAWVDSGIRRHSDRVAAVDELEVRLAEWGPSWRARDEQRAAEKARVEADIERIRAAIPAGWQWAKFGLAGGCWSITRPCDREEPRAPSRKVYECDLYRDPGHADRIIEEIGHWTWPPREAPISQAEEDSTARAAQAPLSLFGEHLP